MNDTTTEAHEVQIEIYRQMSPESRLAVACELSATGRRLIAQGIRRRHPEYTEEELRYAELRLWLGDEDFRRAYPDAPAFDA